MSTAVAAFGLSLEGAWRMTVPDLVGLVAARKRMNAPPAPKPAAGRTLSSDEVRQLRELIEIEKSQAVEWRPLGGSDG